MEDLAGNAKDLEALKEEARKAEILLAEVRTQLSSKTQSLEAANNDVSDLTARIGTLESSAESLESRQQF